MTLEQIYFLSQIVAGAAVVGSILYLALQTRQAAKAQATAVHQARAGRSMDVNLSAAGNAELAEAIAKGLSGDEALTETQYMQFSAYCSALTVSFESGFLSRRAGVMDNDTFTAFLKGPSITISSPGFRAQWLNLRMLRHPEFVAFFDKLIDETPLQERPSSLLPGFRERLATVRARAAQMRAVQAQA